MLLGSCRSSLRKWHSRDQSPCLAHTNPNGSHALFRVLTRVHSLVSPLLFASFCEAISVFAKLMMRWTLWKNCRKDVKGHDTLEFTWAQIKKKMVVTGCNTWLGEWRLSRSSSSRDRPGPRFRRNPRHLTDDGWNMDTSFFAIFAISSALASKRRRGQGCRMDIADRGPGWKIDPG